MVSAKKLRTELKREADGARSWPSAFVRELATANRAETNGLQGKFSAFVRELTDLWEAYWFQQWSSAKVLATMSVSSKRTGFVLVSYMDPGSQKQLAEKDVRQVAQKMSAKTAGVAALTGAIALFDAYIKECAETVWSVWLDRQTGPSGPLAKSIAALSLGQASALKHDVISAYVRFDVLGHSRPFERMLPGYASHPSSKPVEHDHADGSFVEMMARRNLWVHHDGRVDAGYLSSVPSSLLAQGQRAVIDGPYLREAFSVLRQLAACPTGLLVQALGQPITARMRRPFIAIH